MLTRLHRLIVHAQTHKHPCETSRVWFPNSSHRSPLLAGLIVCTSCETAILLSSQGCWSRNVRAQHRDVQQSAQLLMSARVNKILLGLPCGICALSTWLSKLALHIDSGRVIEKLLASTSMDGECVALARGKLPIAVFVQFLCPT